MVFAANAVEGSSKSFEAFVALAKQLNGTSTAISPSGTSSSIPSSNGASTPAGQSVVALLTIALGVLTVL